MPDGVAPGRVVPVDVVPGGVLPGGVVPGGVVPGGVVPGVPLGGVFATPHGEPSRALLIRLIFPLRASTRPITEAPLFSEMLASAIRLPWNAVVVSSVAELPTCQKTLHGDALLISTTELAGAVVRAEAISNTNCAFLSPCPSRVSGPVSCADGVYR